VITRATALVLLVVAVLVPARPAGAIDAPAPGWVSENQSEFGEARIAGTPDGLLVTRPAFGVIQRWRFGHDPENIVTGVHPGLVAYDPAADGVVFTSDDKLLRAVDGKVTTLATQPVGYFGLAVAPDGTVYFSHWVDWRDTTKEMAVSAIAPTGQRRDVVSGIDYLTSLAVEPDGQLLIGHNTRIHRVVDGELQTIAGSTSYCTSPDPCGDEGPATAARFSEITSMVVGDDGSIYLTEHRNARVRVIRPDGIVHDLLGSFSECVKRERFDCLPNLGATSAIQKVVSLAVSGPNLFAIDQDDARRWTRLLQVYDVAQAPTVPPQGYRMIASDGGVFSFGWSPFHGSTGDLHLASPIVAGRSNGAGGYWFVAGDGGVFTFGDAQFFGSSAGTTGSPVVDMAVRTDGRGYTLVERNGSVTQFGLVTTLHLRDLPPYAAIVNEGDEAMRPVAERPSTLPRLNVPIVAAHATKSGNGTWYVASDGGVFTEGDAGFFGSTGAMRLNQPVLDLIPTPTEQGYWLIAADGGVFTFGDAQFMGSMGAVRLNRPVVAGVAGSVASG
jgi:hypothetical protein